MISAGRSAIVRFYQVGLVFLVLAVGVAASWLVA